MRSLYFKVKIVKISKLLLIICIYHYTCATLFIKEEINFLYIKVYNKRINE